MITRTSVSQQQVADLVIGRRAFSACWLSAGFGLTILQMLLLARGWRLGQDALVPALLASAWALGSLLAARMGRRPRLWGVGCLACVLFWLSSPVLSGWRLPETLGLPPVLADSMALALQAVLLGMCGTAWLAQQRAWPVAGEKTTLVRSLVGLTVGLLVAWMLPAVGGLMALVCCLPLLALDAWLSGRAPLPPPGGVAARWRDRYWNAGGWSMQLERRSPLRSWRGPSQSCGSEKVRGTLPLILLASPVAIVLGSVWGAVPTPFAASLHASHSLDVLCWLLTGQLAALAVGACCLLAARNGIGFPARLLPLSWQPPMRGLALLMPLAMAVSLAALGAPALQARWWLALSLAGYTLADAVWCTLLPRLRPDLTTVARSQSHLLLPAQDARLADPFHLAHARACEARAQLLQVRVEGVAIIVCAPLLGWLIDRLGSVDAVLVLVGLAFALGLLCAALAWMFIRVIRRLAQEHSRPGRRGLRISGSSFTRLEATAIH